MTRDETLQRFEVLDDRIVSAGRFEGCAVYAPHFYELMLVGAIDWETLDDEGVGYEFHPTEAERVEYPGIPDRVVLRIGALGNVTCE